MFLKSQGEIIGSGSNDEMSEHLSQMQKAMVVLQKKEHFAKKTLYESQVKWTHFSADIVRVCKELINALEQNKIQSYQMRDVDPKGQRVTGPVRVLTQVKEKISKYDMFLQNNKTELENRDLAASINQEQR